MAKRTLQSFLAFHFNNRFGNTALNLADAGFLCDLSRRKFWQEDLALVDSQLVMKKTQAGVSHS